MSVARAKHPDVVYPATAPFIVLHLACFAAIWTGVTALALLLFVILYFVRLFAVTAGYHRYFSRRSYRMSRGFQFLLALLAQSSTQRGVLSRAAIHRHHHRHSDTEMDVHTRLRQAYPDTPPANLQRVARRTHTLLTGRLGTTPAPPG